MVHCPECGADMADQDDVDFLDVEARSGFFRASKRFYVVGCGECGVAIGGGVAGR